MIPYGMIVYNFYLPEIENNVILQNTIYFNIFLIKIELHDFHLSLFLIHPFVDTITPIPPKYPPSNW